MRILGGALVGGGGGDEFSAVDAMSEEVRQKCPCKLSQSRLEVCLPKARTALLAESGCLLARSQELVELSVAELHPT